MGFYDRQILWFYQHIVKIGMGSQALALGPACTTTTGTFENL
jgi:hypothetical protein